MTPLQALIETIEHDVTLDDPDRLRERLEVLDRIELLQLTGAADRSPGLRQRMAGAQARLEARNAALFGQMRAAIRCGRLPPLLGQCLDQAHREAMHGPGYDWRDELIDGVLQLTPSAPTDAALPADMVAYQPTPARHIFRLLAQARLAADDVLVDLGSGRGQVPLLATICTAAGALGIEREPAYVQCAQAAAGDLRLARACFQCADARSADFAGGTVFYLYTPFKGQVLHAVLESLRHEAQQRAIRIAALGPCVAALAAQSWLQADTLACADRIAWFQPRTRR